MKKPFDKKSTSGLAKKPEKTQTPAAGTGSAPDVKPDRAPQNKQKNKKAAVYNMPMIAVRQPHTVCGESPLCLGAFGADSVHGREHN
jgi:hypothetical protein